MLEQFLAALTAGSRRETFASGFGCVLFEVMCGCFCLFGLVLGFFNFGWFFVFLFCFFLFGRLGGWIWGVFCFVFMLNTFYC